MVWNEAEFEAALKEADAVLDAPPADGTPGHDRMLALLADLASYRSNLFKPAEPPLAQERARLAAHLKDFEGRVVPHYGPHWQALTGANWRYK